MQQSTKTRTTIRQTHGQLQEQSTIAPAPLAQRGFEHFATVDDAKLSETTPNKYTTTTVALVSKYPISNIQSVDKDQRSCSVSWI